MFRDVRRLDLQLSVGLASVVWGDLLAKGNGVGLIQHAREVQLFSTVRLQSHISGTGESSLSLLGSQTNFSKERCIQFSITNSIPNKKE